MVPVKCKDFIIGYLCVYFRLQRITHFEYEDPSLLRDESKLHSLLEGISKMTTLFGLSLPNTVDTVLCPGVAERLSTVIQKLPYLHRLGLQYCNLKGRLRDVLAGVNQRLSYLNLKDCRLLDEDLFFLLSWRPASWLRELNLSCNNFQYLEDVMIALLKRIPALTCLGLSHSSLSTHSMVHILRGCKRCVHLKTLSIQGYIPLPEPGTLELIHVCSQIRTLQKLILFPETYAFPGQNDVEREMNKSHTMSLSYRYLAMRKREDISLV